MMLHSFKPTRILESFVFFHIMFSEEYLFYHIMFGVHLVSWLCLRGKGEKIELLSIVCHDLCLRDTTYSCCIYVEIVWGFFDTDVLV